MRLAMLAVCSFALGVALRDTMQDYAPKAPPIACERQFQREDYATVLVQASDVGGVVRDRRTISDAQILVLLAEQFADQARNPTFESALFAEISIVQQRIARKCEAREEKA